MLKVVEFEKKSHFVEIIGVEHKECGSSPNRILWAFIHFILFLFFIFLFILFYFILFYFILFYFILFYFIFILFYSFTFSPMAKIKHELPLMIVPSRIACLRFPAQALVLSCVTLQSIN